MIAVIYARYSSDSQREASIEGQLRDCKDYAEKNGITVVGTYIDRAYSAKTDDRPDFQRMIKDSGKKIFDVVLVLCHRILEDHSNVIPLNLTHLTFFLLQKIFSVKENLPVFYSSRICKQSHNRK